MGRRLVTPALDITLKKLGKEDLKYINNIVMELARGPWPRPSGPCLKSGPEGHAQTGTPVMPTNNLLTT